MTCIHFSYAKTYAYQVECGLNWKRFENAVLAFASLLDTTHHNAVVLLVQVRCDGLRETVNSSHIVRLCDLCDLRVQHRACTNNNMQVTCVDLFDK
jgi:hypothetical protein